MTNKALQVINKIKPNTFKGFFSGAFGLGSLVAFFFQCLVGLLLPSTVWICAGVYSLFVAGARGIFYFSQRSSVDRAGKLDCAIAISIVMFFADVAFCVLTNLRSLNSQIFHLPFFLIFLLMSFSSFSFLRMLVQLLRITLKKDASFFAYRIVGISGLLKNFVLLQRLILSCLPLQDATIWSINSSFGYFIGSVLILLAVWLFFRSVKQRILL